MVDKNFVKQKQETLTPEHTPVESFDTEIEKAPPTPELAPTTEQREQIPYPEQTTKKEDLDTTIEGLKKKLRKNKKNQHTIPTVKDEITLRIEKVMEEGLADAYRELTPIQQQEFKIKGEETAYKIRQLLKKTHVKIKLIFKLLYEWLKMLPGINKFFLEQEAKIKADKIVAIKNVTDVTHK